MSRSILITSGATREPIDGVRFISNFSSGRTGASIADHFIGTGFEVTYLGGQSAARPERECRRVDFTSFSDLDRALKAELAQRPYDAVIHLAAVSDYSVDAVIIGGERFGGAQLKKIRSEADSIQLVLKRNPKLVRRIADYAEGRKPFVVAFKLTHSASSEERERAVSRIFKGGGVNCVVHNDMSEITEKGHVFTLFLEPGRPIPLGSKGELARALENEIRRMR